MNYKTFTFNRQAYLAETNEMNTLQLAEFLCEHFGDSVGKAWLFNTLSNPVSLDLLLPTSISAKFIYKDSPEGFKFWSNIQDQIVEGSENYKTYL